MSLPATPELPRLYLYIIKLSDGRRVFLKKTDYEMVVKDRTKYAPYLYSRHSILTKCTGSPSSWTGSLLRASFRAAALTPAPLRAPSKVSFYETGDTKRFEGRF